MILLILFISVAIVFSIIYSYHMALQKARKQHKKAQRMLAQAHYTLCQRYGCVVFGVIDNELGTITYTVRHFQDGVEYEYVDDARIRAYIKAHKLFIANDNDKAYIFSDTYKQISRCLRRVAA